MGDQSYKPKVGDRVRVAFEGIVERVYQETVSIDQPGRPDARYFDLKDEGVTIEKLADPEPKWVNGDVIEIKQVLSGWAGWTLHRIDGKWTWSTGDTTTELGVSNCWKNGEVRILYKADAPKVA